MKKNFKQKVITLIALIITVIILLILAGTAISIIANGGDIFEKTSLARNEWNIAVAKENTVITNYITYLDQHVDETTPVENGDLVSLKAFFLGNDFYSLYKVTV